jgi:hypothetical protein
MRVITKQALIATMAERWHATYFRRGRWLPLSSGADPSAIYEQLRELPSTATESDIAAIVGSDYWVKNICSACGQDQPVTVGFTLEVSHPTDETFICQSCIGQAAKSVAEY